jgi:hypothetical protein
VRRRHVKVVGLAAVMALAVVACGGDDGGDGGGPVTTSPSIGVGDEGRPLPDDLTVPTR